jgi:PPOX class probable F420-dependent enzyme
MEDGMAATLTDAQIQVLKNPNFAFMATLMPDGRPQVSPVWIEYDGKHVLINSEEKRLKVRNLKRDPRISVAIAKQENPYEYVEIRGKVVDMTTEGAAEDIDRLAKKYLGQDKYPYNKPGDQRIILKIEPLEVAKTM